MEPIKDVITYDTAGKTVCYRSNLTTYEEQMCDKQYVTAGYNAAGFPQNNQDEYPTKFSVYDFAYPNVFSFEINGETVDYSWKYIGVEKTEETLENNTPVLHVTVSLENENVPVAVKIHTILDGTQAFTRYLEIKNTGDAMLNVGNLTIFGGALQKIDNYANYLGGRNPEKAFSLGYFEHCTWGMEGGFKWHDLQPETISVSGGIKRGCHRHPMAIVRDNVFGNMFMFELGYSGSYTFKFDNAAECVNKDTNAVALSCALCLDENNPLVKLGAGKSMTTPEVHVAFVHGDLDDVVYAMHEHLRKSVFTLTPATLGKEGGLVSSGIGPERVMDFAHIKHTIDTAAAVGAETMIIDAGWYCAPKEYYRWWKDAGNWEYNKELYPNGIDEIRDYAHSKNLLFGMWLDAERIGPDSEIVKQHPEWVVTPLMGKRESMLDMSNPEVCAWVEKQIEKLIVEYKIDLFRLDYNISREERRYSTADGQSGYYHYCNSVYEMYKRLRKKYPHVVFENCAGGGARTDVAMLKNFTHTWVSDHQIAPRSVAITNGMTMALPPEVVDRLASGMNSHTAGSLDFNIRQTLFGKPTTNAYNTLGTQYNPQQIEFVRHTYDIYKHYVRPYACEGRIYHHTPEFFEIQPRGTLILERSDKDRTIGIIGVFSMSATAEPVVVYPKGVLPGKTYRVLFDNSASEVTIDGYRMMTEGLRVEMKSALSSQLIAYEEL